MGHYASEIGGGIPEDVRAAEEAQALRDRGYSDPVKEAGWDSAICIRYTPRLSLRLHVPCGQAVFDPDTHDRYCPATVGLTPEQEALRKGVQFWSDADASYGDN
jgi:hypothetical protein